jgi:hypothetical protein
VSVKSVWRSISRNFISSWYFNWASSVLWISDIDLKPSEGCFNMVRFGSGGWVLPKTALLTDSYLPSY